MLRGGILVLPYGVGHAERLEDVRPRVVPIIHPRNDLDDLPQQREPEIAVLVLDSCDVRERNTALDEPHQFSIRVGQLPVTPGIVLRKPGGVGEQVPDRDLRRVGRQVRQGARLRKVFRNRVVESEPALVAQLQDGHRRDALAHRGDAKQGLRRHRCRRHQLRETEATRIDQLPIQHDTVCEAGHVLPFRVLPELLVDRGRGGSDVLDPVGVGEYGCRLRLQGCGEEQTYQ